MEFKPTVNIVDDDPATRDSMKLLLESVALDVVCFDTSEAFLESRYSSRPGCLLLDLRMPGMSGLELQETLRKRDVSTPIIFLTGHGNISSAVRAMQAGAVDFVTKPVNDESLIEKVHAAIATDREQRLKARGESTVQARLDLLTPREREVLEGVVAGKSNKELARELGISHKTVELHRGNMMTKMHAGSVAEVVQMRLTVNSP
jgi:FixJ family two-component response regulator